MTFTRHGHHIPGTVLGDDRPKRVARCGGPGLCRECTVEARASSFHHKESSPILRHFSYDHLPQNLAVVSQQFHALAHSIDVSLPQGPEKTKALDKLLEAKDAAVRAALPDPE